MNFNKGVNHLIHPFFREIGILFFDKVIQNFNIDLTIAALNCYLSFKRKAQVTKFFILDSVKQSETSKIHWWLLKKMFLKKSNPMIQIQAVDLLKMCQLKKILVLYSIRQKFEKSFNINKKKVTELLHSTRDLKFLIQSLFIADHITIHKSHITSQQTLTGQPLKQSFTTEIWTSRIEGNSSMRLVQVNMWYNLFYTSRIAESFWSNSHPTCLSYRRRQWRAAV